MRASNASGRRPPPKTKPALRSAAQVAPIEDQIHRVFVAREEERCRKLEAEYARDPKKARKKVARPPVPKPWLRPVPQALLQDPDLLLLVTDHDYDITDPGFQEYCRSRGVFHVAGEEGSKRRAFFQNCALTKDDFLGDTFFHFAQPLNGKTYTYTSHEMQVAWDIVCLGRAKLQDCWELYRSSAATGRLVAGAQMPAADRRSPPKAKRPATVAHKGPTRKPGPKRQRAQLSLFQEESPGDRTVRRVGRRNRKR